MIRYNCSFRLRSICSFSISFLILLGLGSATPLLAQQLKDYKYTKEGVQIGYKQRSGATDVSFARPPETDLPPQLAQAWRTFNSRTGGQVPGGFGKAKVETKGYGTEIEAVNFVLPCPAE